MPRPSFARPIVRKSYDFGKERVHLAITPIEGEPLPLYRCDRCERDRSELEFGFVVRPYTDKAHLARLRHISARHPMCFKCREQRRGEHIGHALYTPALDRYCDKLVSHAKGGGRSRGILFALDKDDALGMYLKQEGRCALTGLPLDWKTPGHKGRSGRNYKAPSIDRIDSAGNYVLGNVHIVMSIVNIMKNDLPVDMFVALCREVAAHNVSL